MGQISFFWRKWILLLKSISKTSCRQAAFVRDARCQFTGTWIPTRDVCRFCSHTDEKNSRLKRVEVTFWKRNMGYASWGVAGEPNLRASLPLFWVVRNRAGRTLRNAYRFKGAVWESVHLNLHRSQCLQNQYLKSIISKNSNTGAEKEKKESGTGMVSRSILKANLLVRVSQMSSS